MLHILFLILKIIGITILIFVGIAILLLCTVLFVPIRYEAKAVTPDGIEQLNAKIRVSWLLRIFSFRGTYCEKKFVWDFKIFGIKLKFRKKKIKKAEEKRVKQDKKTEQKKVSEKDKKEKKVGWFKRTISKLKRFWNIKKLICDFIKNSIHKKGFRKFKKEVGLLAKRYKPRKIKGNVRFGREDPYETGKILAILSVLYPFYCENVQIEPDFENSVLEGKLEARGHMRLWWLTVCACRLFFDRHFRKTMEDGRRCIDKIQNHEI